MSEDHLGSKQKSAEPKLSPKPSQTKIEASKSKTKTGQKANDMEGKSPITAKTSQEHPVQANKCQEELQQAKTEVDRSGKKEALIERHLAGISQAQKSMEKNEKDAAIMKSMTKKTIKEGHNEVDTNQKETGTHRAQSEVSEVQPPKNVGTQSKKTKLAESGPKKSKTATKPEDKTSGLKASASRQSKVKSHDEKKSKGIHGEAETQAKQKDQQTVLVSGQSVENVPVSKSKSKKNSPIKDLVKSVKKSSAKRAKPTEVVTQQQVKRSVSKASQKARDHSNPKGAKDSRKDLKSRAKSNENSRSVAKSNDKSLLKNKIGATPILKDKSANKSALRDKSDNKSALGDKNANKSKSALRDKSAIGSVAKSGKRVKMDTAAGTDE